MADITDTPMPTVDAIYAARERDAANAPNYDGYGISASLLGNECNRALWYQLRWASVSEVFDGRKLRIFERGNIEEDRVLEDLRRAGLKVRDVDPDTGEQWRFSVASGWIRGKADGRCWGVIEAPKAEHVLEIKSLKALDWRAIRKHGLQKKKLDHWQQLHIGMHALGVNRGIYIGVNKDTEEILTERLRLDVEDGNRQEARVLNLISEHDAPLKIKENPDDFPCRFCRHKAVCHTGQIARRHCRSCIHFTYTTDGHGHCARFDETRDPGQQHEGLHCPAHLFLPALVPGEQIDANPTEEWIEYRMADGSVWRNGQEEKST